MCECVLCTIQDSHIQKSRSYISSYRERLSKKTYTPFEETVAQILQVEYNVVLKRSPEKIATYLFTHPYRYNIMNHLYFGIVSFHTEERGPCACADKHRR
jgi:hypothetical protein